MTPEGAGAPAVVVRAATLADAGGVARVVVECRGGSTEEHRQGFLREMAGAGADNLVLLAQVGDEIAGFARARRFEPPAPAPERTAPAGWYLLGVEVAPAHRRKGVGAELTRARLRWIAERADEAFYFTQDENHASIALHAPFGFREVSRGVEYPRAPGPSSARVLYRVELHSPARRRRTSSSRDSCEDSSSSRTAPGSLTGTPRTRSRTS